MRHAEPCFACRNVFGLVTVNYHTHARNGDGFAGTGKHTSLTRSPLNPNAVDRAHILKGLMRCRRVVQPVCPSLRVRRSCRHERKKLPDGQRVRLPGGR